MQTSQWESLRCLGDGVVEMSLARLIQGETSGQAGIGEAGRVRSLACDGGGHVDLRDAREAVRSRTFQASRGRQMSVKGFRRQQKTEVREGRGKSGKDETRCVTCL